MQAPATKEEAAQEEALEKEALKDAEIEEKLGRVTSHTVNDGTQQKCIKT